MVIVVGGLLAAVGQNWSLFGFALSGWAWVLAFVTAGIQVFRHLRRVTFPIALWLPWVCFLLAYLFVSYHENAVERTAMLICPILVGAAASTSVVSDKYLRHFLRRLRWIGMYIVAVSLVHLGVLVTGRLPGTSGLAPEAMTAALLASMFVAMAAGGAPRTLGMWLTMVAVPVLGVTRTGIVATAVTFPTTLAKIGIPRRVAAAALVAAAGLALFYTSRVQHKMFYSGSGTLNDVRLANPDFATSGRLRAWDFMEAEIAKRPWFGHGTNADEEFLFEIYKTKTQPHNDWLRLEFDYGYVGTVLFGATFLAQGLFGWWFGRSGPGLERVLFLGAASAFIPFAIFMITDNIILYAVFFGNLQFLILGLAYAARAARLRGASAPRVAQDARPIGRGVVATTQWRRHVGAWSARRW